MTAQEAAKMIEAVVKAVHSCGFGVNGWDDGSIIVTDKDHVEAYVEPVEIEYNIPTPRPKTLISETFKYGRKG